MHARLINMTDNNNLKSDLLVRAEKFKNKGEFGYIFQIALNFNNLVLHTLKKCAIHKLRKLR